MFVSFLKVLMPYVWLGGLVALALGDHVAWVFLWCAAWMGLVMLAHSAFWSALSGTLGAYADLMRRVLSLYTHLRAGAPLPSQERDLFDRLTVALFARP